MNEVMNVLITCKKCGYIWNYRGRSRYATCPMCLSKVKVDRDDIITIQCLLCDNKITVKNRVDSIYRAGWGECIVITAGDEVQAFICPHCLRKFVYSDEDKDESES